MAFSTDYSPVASVPLSQRPRRCEQHPVQQPLFLAAAGVAGGQGVGEAQEVGAASCSALSRLRRASVRPDAWNSMAAWTRSRVVASRLLSVSSTGVTAGRRLLLARPLTVGAASGNRLSWPDAAALVSISSARVAAPDSPNSSLPGRDGPQADTPLAGVDDAVFPFLHVDAEGLGELSRHIEGQAEPRRAATRRRAVAVILLGGDGSRCGPRLRQRPPRPSQVQRRWVRVPVPYRLLPRRVPRYLGDGEVHLGQPLAVGGSWARHFCCRTMLNY